MEITDKIIIDLQFVIGNEKENLIKEMTILELESSKLQHYIFKPKFHYLKLNTQAKIQNFYNYKYINGLRWIDGTLDYKEIYNILINFVDKVIIVKGVDKKQILQSYLPTTNIIDLDMNKSLEVCLDPGICCKLHENRLKLRCAYKNVFKIKKYMNDYKFETIL